MGSVSSTFRSYVYPPTEIRIIMIGNNNASKTTILYQLKINECVTTTLTTGFNVETIPYNNFFITIWEVCSRGNSRFLWRYYATQTVGLIFVVDSNDEARIHEAKEDLWEILNGLDRSGLPKVPLLVYANKQEVQSAMRVGEVRDALDLMSLQDREWHIHGVSAVLNEGLWEGLDWLLTQVKDDMKKNKRMSSF